MQMKLLGSSVWINYLSNILIISYLYTSRMPVISYKKTFLQYS